MRGLGRTLGLLAVGAAVTAGGACNVSGSVGTPAVKKQEVEKQVSTEVGKQLTKEPDSVTCPADLKATVGTTMRCEVKVGTETFGLTVTVTSADEGGPVKFDIKSDEPATTTTTVP